MACEGGRLFHLHEAVRMGGVSLYISYDTCDPLTAHCVAPLGDLSYVDPGLLSTVVLMLRGPHPLQSPGRFTFQHRIPDYPSGAIFPGRKSELRGVCGGPSCLVWRPYSLWLGLNRRRCQAWQDESGGGGKGELGPRD